MRLEKDAAAGVVEREVGNEPVSRRQRHKGSEGHKITKLLGDLRELVNLVNFVNFVNFGTS